MFKPPANSQRLLGDHETADSGSKKSSVSTTDGAPQNLPPWMKLYQQVLARMNEIEDLCKYTHSVGSRPRIDKEFLKTKELKQKKNVFGKQDEVDTKLQELTGEATDVLELFGSC